MFECMFVWLRLLFVVNKTPAPKKNIIYAAKCAVSVFPNRLIMGEVT